MVDKELRNKRSNGKRTCFIHKSATPIDEVEFDPYAEQLNLFNNECEGMCGV